jgi:hypothetical protein
MRLALAAAGGECFWVAAPSTTRCSRECPSMNAAVTCHIPGRVFREVEADRCHYLRQTAPCDGRKAAWRGWAVHGTWEQPKSVSRCRLGQASVSTPSQASGTPRHQDMSSSSRLSLRASTRRAVLQNCPQRLQATRPLLCKTSAERTGGGCPKNSFQGQRPALVLMRCRQQSLPKIAT